MRRGRLVKNPTGIQYFYCYINSTITNDSLIPMHIKLGFSEDNYEPTPSNGQTFKVFLQPDILSNSEVKKRLEGLYSPLVLDTIINPKEKIDITIGFVTESISPLNLNPLPFVLSSKGHYQAGIPSTISDSLINEFAKDRNQLGLLLDLNFSKWGSDSIKHYSVIPCGEISFSKFQQ
jgi:hypothetical protein